MTETPGTNDELHFGLGHSAPANPDNNTTECANCAARINVDDTYYTVTTLEYKGERTAASEGTTNLCPDCFDELPRPLKIS